MPTPKPHEGESHDDFMGRCMGDDVMMDEWPDGDQRMAVCAVAWGDKGRSRDMQIKQISASLKAISEKGEGTAVFATLNVVDLDGDVTLPGAFGEQVAPMVPAHDWQEAPIGKALIHEVGNEAHADFKLNLATSAGKDWYEALKFDLDHPPAKQQYSYGFSIIESEMGDHEGQRVRFLKKLKIHEVSPVLLAAGLATRTLALKNAHGPEDLGLKMAEQLARSIEYLENTIARIEEVRDMRAKAGRKLSQERLGDIARLKSLLERVKGLLGDMATMRTTEEVTAGYFDLRHRLAAEKSLTGAGNP